MRLYLVERYLAEVVVEVGVVGAGDNQQFLVVAGQLLVGVLAEVARMSLLPMDKQHGSADFACVRQYRHVQERECRCLVPATVGVKRTLVVTALRLIIGEVVFQELRSVIGHHIGQASGKFIRTVAIVCCTLCIQLAAQFVACVGIVGSIEIAIGIDTAHVVHGSGYGGLDAGVDGCGIDCHATPTADAENTYLFRVHIVAS